MDSRNISEACARSNGRKDTARSASGFPVSMQQQHIFEIKRSIIARELFREEFVAMLQRHGFDYDERMLD
jgi:hypothetical protein